MRRLLSVFRRVPSLTTASPASPAPASPASPASPALSTHSIPSTSNSRQVSLAPLFETPDGIENAYMVAFKKNISPAAFDAHINFVQNEVQHAQLVDGCLQKMGGIYNSHILKGYAGTFARSTIDKIRARPEVNYVEVDQYFTTYHDQIVEYRQLPMSHAPIWESI